MLPLGNLRRLMAVALVLLCSDLVLALPVHAQLGEEEAENAAASTVLLTAQIWQEEDGQSRLNNECAMGSGTIISEGGVILTNSHVLDVWEAVESIARAEESELRAQNPGRGIVLTRKSEVFVWMVDGQDRIPTKRYSATPRMNGSLDPVLRPLDLALLEITGDSAGKQYDRPRSGLAHLDLGDSDSLDSGSAVTIFGYPSLDAVVSAAQEATPTVVDACVRRRRRPSRASTARSRAPTESLTRRRYMRPVTPRLATAAARRSMPVAN